MDGNGSFIGLRKTGNFLKNLCLVYKSITDNRIMWQAINSGSFHGQFSMFLKFEYGAPRAEPVVPFLFRQEA
ncbi:MAG: hypothetical protein ACE5D1_07310, partial [Fidelibacterota bacterium]